jgi:hypothetical protein
VPCGRTDGQTDMTKLTVTFRSFANAPNNWRNKVSPAFSSRYIKHFKFIETHSEFSLQAAGNVSHNLCNLQLNVKNQFASCKILFFLGMVKYEIFCQL